MAFERPTRYQWAFGHRVQADIHTAVSAGLLTKQLPFRNFTPAMMEKTIHSDREYFGKGHDFASRVDELAEQIKFARTFDATAESLSWALSLLMGDVDTSGPVGAYYTHLLNWVDPAVQKECLYTSLIEKSGAEYQKLLSGAFVEQVEITAEMRENLQIAVTMSARKQIDDVTSMPDVTPSVVFRTNHATIQLGASGGQSFISEQVVKWNLRLGQAPDVRWVPGQTSGEEKLLRYALIGPQTVGGSITLFLDADERARFLNHDKVGLTIINKGVFDVNNIFKIEIPAFYINAENIAQGGQTTELTLEFNEDTIIKDSAVDGSPIRITLVNPIAALIQ